MSLTTEQAKQFFGSLYEKSPSPDLGAFEGAAIRLVVKTDQLADSVPTKDVAPGDKALGVLMLNHIMTARDVEPATKAALTAATLMNIKSEVVSKFTELFPQTSLSDLIDAAREAGYQVDVLEPAAARSAPRSIIGR